ncbi:hypothetical protein HK101_007150, partial [Irineochytrium annulatum]
LKDAVIEEPSKHYELYLHLVKMMWKMYHKCKLVHADLSEYNLLYHNDTLYIIDVSQSVEHDHPHALEFLRKDCNNVIDFFAKRCDARIMTTRDLFDFVVGALPETAGLDEDARLDSHVKAVHESIGRRPADYGEAAEEQVAAAVFQSSFIPRTLEEVQDVEQDVERVRKGMSGGAVDLYGKVIGIVGVEGVGKVNGEADEGEEDSVAGETDGNGSGGDDEEGCDDGSDGDEDADEDGEGHEEEFGKKSRLKKEEDKEAKKDQTVDVSQARKAATKEEKREKRKTKIPKAVKKRKEKVAAEKSKGKK